MTSWPISVSSWIQIAVWVPYPLGAHGAHECHKIRATRRSLYLSRTCSIAISRADSSTGNQNNCSSVSSSTTGGGQPRTRANQS